DDGLVAADHHAIAAFETPDAAAGADVNVMDSFFTQRLCAPDIVLPKGVSAIDDDVVAVEQFGEGIDGGFGDLPGRQHDPDGAGLFELLDEVLQALCPRRSIAGNRGDRLAVFVIHDGLMTTFFHETANDVGSHSPQADHTYLHYSGPLSRRARRP